MPSLVYTSFYEDSFKGLINCTADTFKMMLVTSSYTPAKSTHTRRSDVTNEVTGTGYTSGGVTITPTVNRDTVNNKVTISFTAASWPAATITAQAGVVYKSTGAASADPLVGYVDFGGGSSTSGPFTVIISSPLEVQN